MSKYTQGPWRDLRDKSGILTEIAAPCHEHGKGCRKSIVFRVTHDLPDWTSRTRQEHVEACVCEGNFSLWQAAPDMLAALKIAEIWLANCIPIGEPTPEKPLPIIHAAIVKAEGGQ